MPLNSFLHALELRQPSYRGSVDGAVCPRSRMVRPTSDAVAQGPVVRLQQLSPQIVGLRPPIRRTNIPVDKQCESTKVNTVYVLRGEELVETWCVDRNCANRLPTAHPDLPRHVHTKFCSICHRLAVISLSNYGSHKLDPFRVVRLGLRSRKWHQSKLRPRSIRLEYTLCISCTV